MTIRKKRPKKELVIDLTGPDGNAFALMAYAERFARQLGLNSEKIIEEMMASDYENLLQVFDSNFGSFVILER
jgi:pantoate kinase